MHALAVWLRRHSLAVAGLVLLAIPSSSEALTPNDPAYGNQWPLHTNGIYGSPMLNMPGAWDRYTGSSADTLGFLTIGLPFSHPDYNARMLTWGYGPESVENTGLVGIAGASGDNGQWIAGVNWNSVLRVHGLDFATSQKVDVSMAWLIDQHVRTVVLPWNLGISDPADEVQQDLQRAFERAYKADVLVFATAPATTDPFEDPRSNASYWGNDLVFPITSLNRYSNYSDWDKSWSTMAFAVPTGDTYEWFTTTSWYAGAPSVGQMRGNPAGAAMAAGVASLVRGYAKTKGLMLCNDDVINVMRMAASLNGSWDSMQGYGYLDAGEALALLDEPNGFLMSEATGGTDMGVASGWFLLPADGRFGTPTNQQYLARTHLIERDVTFDPVFSGSAKAWGRRVASYGSCQNGATSVSFCEVVPGSLTSNGCRLRTYALELTVPGGGGVEGLFPPAASVKYAYTVFGARAALSATTTPTAPQTLGLGQVAECAVQAAGGWGGYTYRWEQRDVGHWLEEFPWQGGATTPTVNVACDEYDVQVRVFVSDGHTTLCDTLPCIANGIFPAAPVPAIAGPTVVPAGLGGTWSASALRGRTCGEYSYEWRCRPAGTSTWSAIIGGDAHREARRFDRAERGCAGVRISGCARVRARGYSSC